MGYRVGLQCFESIEVANDFVLSQTAPVINAEGKLIYPQKVGKEWFLNGDKVVLSFPECSVVEQFSSGVKLASPFLTIFVLIFCFRLVAKFISGMGVHDGN